MYYKLKLANIQLIWLI